MKRITCILLLICMLSSCAESNISSDSQINTSEPSAAVTDTTSSETKTEKSTEDNVKSTDITEFLSEKNVFSLYEISETEYLLTSFHDEKFLTEMVCLEGDGNISTFISDAPPVYEENGLWILHKTVSDPYDNDVNVNNSDKLICYDYNLNKIAEIDISGLDNVSACSVDFDNRHVYYTQDEIIDGCESHCLKRMDFDGSTEILHEIKYDFSSGGSYILASIHQIKVLSDRIIFLGGVMPKADGTAQSVAAYGTFLKKDGTIDFHYRTDTFGYRLEPFNSGAVIHDSDVDYNVAPDKNIRYYKDTEMLNITLQNPLEATGVSVSKNGRFIVTEMSGKKTETSSLNRITIYDNTGNVLKQEDIDGVLWNVFINEHSRKIVYSLLNEQQSRDWYSISF